LCTASNGQVRLQITHQMIITRPYYYKYDHTEPVVNLWVLSWSSMLMWRHEPRFIMACISSSSVLTIINLINWILPASRDLQALLNLVGKQVHTKQLTSCWTPTDKWNHQQQADFIKSTALLLMREHSAVGRPRESLMWHVHASTNIIQLLFSISNTQSAEFSRYAKSHEVLSTSGVLLNKDAGIRRHKNCYRCT
jgi:hypothetical protein